MPAEDMLKRRYTRVFVLIPLIYYSFYLNILGVTVTSGTPTGQAERVVTTVPQYSIAPPYYYEQGQNTYQVCIYDVAQIIMLSLSSLMQQWTLVYYIGIIMFLHLQTHE